MSPNFENTNLQNEQGEKVKYKEKKLSESSFVKPEEYLQEMLENGLFEQAQAYKKVIELSEKIKAVGGQALLVGGSVRDYLMGKIAKDFDVEVYGLEADKIEKIANTVGKVSDVGRSFGILKIFLDNNIDIDVSLPRIDSKTGAGHRGFAVQTDPNMSIRDAAQRRDFTMNSLSADPLTGKLYDPFDGVNDIKERVLRITDKELFKDDPLRVLRGIQFIGRFGLEIDEESFSIMKSMLPQLNELPKERLAEEWKKLLLKSPKPSLGLQAGLNLGVWQEMNSELVELNKTEQEPKWHPEGNVWMHTLMVVDEAAKIAYREELDHDESMVLLLSALCHDLGKPEVSEYKDGKIISYGHEKAGEEPSKKFLKKIGIKNEITNKVVKIVMNHLHPTTFYVNEKVRGNKITDGAIRRLAKRIAPATIKELILLGEADHLGRGDFSIESKNELLIDPDKYPVKDWLLERARNLHVEESVPEDLTRGRDWLRLGVKPGPIVGELIKVSNLLRDEKEFSRGMVLAIAKDIESEEEMLNILKSRLDS